MDPNAVLGALVDAMTELRDAVNAGNVDAMRLQLSCIEIDAEALGEWLAHDGFAPTWPDLG